MLAFPSTEEASVSGSSVQNCQGAKSDGKFSCENVDLAGPGLKEARRCCPDLVRVSDGNHNFASAEVILLKSVLEFEEENIRCVWAFSPNSRSETGPGLSPLMCQSLGAD